MQEIIQKTRTYRKFDASQQVTLRQLEELIGLARLAGSARNCQPWQYLPVVEEKLCDDIFPYLGWAGYLTDWKGPEPHERPTAYVLCFLNNNWLKGSLQEAHFDLGIASQNILLGATTQGLGGCRIGAFSPKLASLFTLPDHLQLLHVIALGVPAETVVLEDCHQDEIKYWRDADNVHHVPKRRMVDILLGEDILKKDPVL